MGRRARHPRTERHGRVRCPVDQLRLPRHRARLGHRQGDPRLGSLHGIARHGARVAPPRRGGRQGGAAPDHPRVSRGHGHRHVWGGSRAGCRRASRLAVAHRPRHRRHAGRDQCRRRGSFQSPLAQLRHGAHGDRISAGRNRRWHVRAETAGDRHLARGVSLRCLGDERLPAHRVAAGAGIRGVSRPAPPAAGAGEDQSHSDALRCASVTHR